MRSSTTGSGRCIGSDRHGARNGGRRLHEDLITRARQVDAEHWAARGRPASAETLRIRLRVGAASARHLKDVLRNQPADTATAATAALAH